MSSFRKDLNQIEADVMRQLKDFQRATVEYLDSLYRSGQRRILVSDEVGLGKTLIARGMVVKMAQLRKEEGDHLVKVVYICSNAAIARQNMNKLLLTRDDKTEDTHSSRLSMQHLNIFLKEHDQEALDRFIQFIPLTPSTSFRVSRDRGTYSERALMFALLRRVPDLTPYAQGIERILKDRAVKGWNSWARKTYDDQVVACDEKTGGRYLEYMIPEIKKRLQAQIKGQPLTEIIKALAGGEKETALSPGELIGELRILFARISVDLLKPDFVIMDEFQRFKYLIDENEENETTMLARHFFQGEGVRILLLSATPYKMYSTLEEIDETSVDEHYSEFFRVMDFLNVRHKTGIEFHEVWRDYARQLRSFTKGDLTVLEAKQVAEDTLYSAVARTERVTAREIGDLIDDSSVRQPIPVTSGDIRSYVDAQKLLTEIGLGYKLPVDYAKSSPYLLSFMRDYQVKRDIERYFRHHPEEMKKAHKLNLWLRRYRIDEFKAIDPNNARLRYLQDLVFQKQSNLLMWVPPSKPYYELGGVFKEAERFTKTLIFSSWEMVPRMIASLVSYESERLNIELLKRSSEEAMKARYFASDTKTKRYPAARLNFSPSKGEPKGMPLFCLVYPSRFLAGCFDPIECLNEQMTLDKIRTGIQQRILTKLEELDRSEDEVESNRADERWYYLAPFFLDKPEEVERWLAGGQALAEITDQTADGEQSGAKESRTGFLFHLDTLRQLLRDKDLKLGKQPDDLMDVLCDIALASPAVCAYRTYGQLHQEEEEQLSNKPSQLAKILINRLNTSESTALIEAASGKRNTAPHWKNVLAYCRDGNLQAVLDEYAHIIIESNNLSHHERKTELLHSIILESMNVHSASYRVDTFNAFRDRLKGKKSNDLQIRTHFAVAFTNSDGSKEKELDRKSSVRNSFNSPFRPFVLATTSIGQEGLDFHYYCRRIVHWNLPSNPIDLEQREGRINRFKSLAIRQNVAIRYGNGTFRDNIWPEIFEAALEQEKAENGSDLVPFWGLQNSEDMIKIERIVPMYPFSRDIAQYHRLIKILSLYRLALGQPRQEELIEHLFRQHSKEDLEQLFINLSPFYKGRKNE